MSRDSTIACVAAISLHALVLFGLPAREKPPLPPPPDEFVEVALVDAPRLGQPVAAPAPNPQPEATPTPPPQPEIKPEPEPEPIPEPAPIIPEPTPEQVTIPVEPTPPAQPQPQTTAPVKPTTNVASTGGPVGPSNSTVGPIGVVGTPDGTGTDIPEGAAIELRKATISYPTQARRLKQQGTVLVRIQVSVPGRPDKVEVITSSGFPLLDEAAVDAANRSRYRPAYKGNRPIPSTFTKPYTFKLE